MPHDALLRIHEVFRTDPARCGVFLDFDGVLAPIQDDPEASRPLPELLAELRLLARSIGTLCVVSGRPLSFLAVVLGELDRCALYGSYGLQWRTADGRIESHPDVSTYLEPMRATVAAARREFPELLVEDKTTSMTLHYRTRPQVQAAVTDWASAEAERRGLRLLTGRMVVELAMPIDWDKGAVVGAAIRSLAGALYVGDDIGDVPAFQALRAESQRRSDFAGLGVGVLNGSPVAEVVANTDLQLGSPHELVGLLRGLDDALS